MEPGTLDRRGGLVREGVESPAGRLGQQSTSALTVEIQHADSARGCGGVAPVDARDEAQRSTQHVPNAERDGLFVPVHHIAIGQVRDDGRTPGSEHFFRDLPTNCDVRQWQGHLAGRAGGLHLQAAGFVAEHDEGPLRTGGLYRVIEYEREHVVNDAPAACVTKRIEPLRDVDQVARDG